jgi:hypothetical protein
MHPSNTEFLTPNAAVQLLADWPREGAAAMAKRAGGGSGGGSGSGSSGSGSSGDGGSCGGDNSGDGGSCGSCGGTYPVLPSVR